MALELTVDVNDTPAVDDDVDVLVMDVVAVPLSVDAGVVPGVWALLRDDVDVEVTLVVDDDVDNALRDAVEVNVMVLLAVMVIVAVRVDVDVVVTDIVDIGELLNDDVALLVGVAENDGIADGVFAEDEVADVVDVLLDVDDTVGVCVDEPVGEISTGHPATTAKLLPDTTVAYEKIATVIPAKYSPVVAVNPTHALAEPVAPRNAEDDRGRPSEKLHAPAVPATLSNRVTLRFAPFAV